MNPNLILQETAGILISVGASFLHILPYLALSVPLAVLLKRSGAAEKIRTGLSGNPYLAVGMATLVGALSPFCSCGVIPVIAALLLGGVPLAPVMSFWLASPSMDPEIFILSVGSIGWELAVWRLAATFAMSLFGGLVILYFEKRGWIGHAILRASISRQPGEAPSINALAPVTASLAPVACCPGMDFALPSVTVDSCCQERPLPSAPFRAECHGDQTQNESLETPQGTSTPACGCPSSFGWRGMGMDAVSTTLNLSMYMVVAFFLEAIIIRFVPQNLIASHLGSQSPWSVPLATLISIPMYTTNLTSLGLISGLLQRGMSGGAALAFLIGGAVTTLPAMSAVFGIVRWRVFLLYLSFCISGALLSGFAYQLTHPLWK